MVFIGAAKLFPLVHLRVVFFIFCVTKFCFQLFCWIYSAEIENSLVSYPLIRCEDNSLIFSFDTLNPFLGRVFVKSMADDERCSRNFANNVEQTNFSVVIQHGDCNMMKQRTRTPSEGIVFSVVLVISFHGTFITKLDKSYRLMCFFKTVHFVTNIIDISMLTTSELYNSVRLPTCTYSIRELTSTGSLIRYAKVGDKLVHVWECDDDQYGLLIHSCSVDNGRGTNSHLVDANGCSVDPVILAELKYDPTLTKATAETFGFKFSDTSSLQFFCSVEVCQKKSLDCAGMTPPNCSRRKREIISQNSPKDTGFDLSYSIDMLDMLEPYTVKSFSTFLNQSHYANSTTHSLKLSGITCLSTVALGILLSVILIFLISSFVIVAMVIWKSHSKIKMWLRNLCQLN